ncbi:hypothetical protein PPERSA_09465 [Pseudocohnilembus persalinus]|uniref:Uncharacterized protein n=1 Tax=Pseudocohnilembus persalinus TaxID=266149 RepID=A0A0V0QR60_PSEPJ|nr:hypothetical protein PPERSA_09465 [Pseudocohnilembus persalinus]|eukprot:KRX04673.1 hypothetical protein PPERSA_09465 [Pseudocohnilembus persalinus]
MLKVFIKCSECKKKPATIRCFDCKSVNNYTSKFCYLCDSRIHQYGQKIGHQKEIIPYSEMYKDDHHSQEFTSNSRYEYFGNNTCSQSSDQKQLLNDQSDMQQCQKRMNREIEKKNLIQRINSLNEKLGKQGINENPQYIQSSFKQLEKTTPLKEQLSPINNVFYSPNNQSIYRHIKSPSFISQNGYDIQRTNIIKNSPSKFESDKKNQASMQHNKSAIYIQDRQSLYEKQIQLKEEQLLQARKMKELKNLQQMEQNQQPNSAFFKRQNQQTEKQEETISQKNDDAQSQIQELKNDNKELQWKIKQLNDQHQSELENLNRDYQQQLITQQQNKDSDEYLQKQIRQYQSEISQLNSKCKKLENQIENSKNYANSSIQQQIKSYQETIKYQQEIINQNSQDENSNQRGHEQQEFNELQQSLKEKKQVIQQLEDNLNIQKNNMENKYIALEKILQKKDQIVEELTKNVQIKDMENKKMEELIDNFKALFQQITEEKNILQQENIQQQQKNKKLEQQLSLCKQLLQEQVDNTLKLASNEDSQEDVSNEMEDDNQNEEMSDDQSMQ